MKKQDGQFYGHRRAATRAYLIALLFQEDFCVARCAQIAGRYRGCFYRLCNNHGVSVTSNIETTQELRLVPMEKITFRLDVYLLRVGRTLIQTTLQRCDDRRTQAACRLGFNRTHFARVCIKHGVPHARHYKLGAWDRPIPGSEPIFIKPEICI